MSDDSKVVDLQGKAVKPVSKSKRNVITTVNKCNKLLQPMDEEEFFRSELAALGLYYNYPTRSYHLKTKEDIDVQLTPPELWAMLTGRGNLETQLTEAELSQNLIRWTKDREYEILLEKRSALSVVDREKGQAELAKFLSLICREGEELSQVIMTQFVWLVRRKLFGLPAVSHVMPVLQGGQGSGKSTVIKMLIEPMRPYTSKWDVYQITDERNYLELARTYIGYVEEMAGMKGSALAKLKSIITAETENVRLFNTQTRTTVNVNITFIADTNGSVRDIIRDETGGRRFWEIRCKDEMDLKALQGIDYHAIWGCVSEYDECPTQTSEHFQRIKQLQSDKIRHSSTPRQWLAEESELKPGDKPIKVADLYDRYRNWCSDNREQAAPIQTWSKEMGMHGFERKQVRVKNKVVRAFLVAG